MKKLVTIILMLIPLYSISQSICDYRSIGYNTSPAPCSIEDRRTVTQDKYVIQVGVYRRFITSFPNTVMIPIKDYDSQEGYLYYYFYAPEGKLLWEYSEAASIRHKLREMEIFCDAKEKPVKNFFNLWGFSYRDYN